jgi:hypothetical protein
MRTLIALGLFLLASAIPAAETVATKDKRSIAYDTIEFDPKTPKTAIFLRAGSSLTVLKLSEVERAELPAAQRDQLDAFTKAQKKEGLVLVDDEWINRDEYLLKLDPRFDYPKKLRRTGTNVLKVVNPGERRVTLGVRSGDTIKKDQKGLEFSVEPGKTKALGGIPDGKYSFYFVFETEGDASLEVHQSESMAFKNVEYTLTMAPSAKGGIRTTPVGSIDIPPAMRGE